MCSIDVMECFVLVLCFSGICNNVFSFNIWRTFFRMIQYLSPELLQHNCRKNNVFLAFSLIAGFMSGGFLFSLCAPEIFPLMRISVVGYVSIVGSMFPVLFPFLISAYAVYSMNSWILYLHCFMHSIALSFLSLGFSVFGWLVRDLLLFYPLVSFPLLFYFWRICLCKGKDKFWKSSFVFLLFFCLIRWVDICYIAPLCRKLLIL